MAKRKAKAVAKKKVKGKATAVSPEVIEELRSKGRSVVRRLKKLFPVAECALDHDSPFQLLVATILSAQCTDERVNMATPELFRCYPNAEALKNSTQEDVERIVQPLGFFRAKAKNIRGMAAKLVDDYEGEIPQDIDEMLKRGLISEEDASVATELVDS